MVSQNTKKTIHGYSARGATYLHVVKFYFSTAGRPERRAYILVADVHGVHSSNNLVVVYVTNRLHSVPEQPTGPNHYTLPTSPPLEGLATELIIECASRNIRASMSLVCTIWACLGLHCFDLLCFVLLCFVLCWFVLFCRHGAAFNFQSFPF